MVDFDIKSYIVLYLKNAQEEIKSIRSLLNQKEIDVTTLHRISHSLKGQSYFVGFHDIGDKALKMEKYYKDLLDKNQITSQEKNPDIELILNEIEKLLITKQT